MVHVGLEVEQRVILHDGLVRLLAVDEAGDRVGTGVVHGRAFQEGYGSHYRPRKSCVR